MVQMSQNGPFLEPSKMSLSFDKSGWGPKNGPTNVRTDADGRTLGSDGDAYSASRNNVTYYVTRDITDLK